MITNHLKGMEKSGLFVFPAALLRSILPRSHVQPPPQWPSHPCCPCSCRSVCDWILINIKDIIYDNGVGYAIMGLDEGYGTILLHKIDFIKSIAVSNLTEMDENITTCKIKIIADLILYLSGDPDDFLHSKSWREFFDYNMSECHVNISTWHSVSTDIVISIVIDNAESKIISYDPISVDSEYGNVSFEW